MKERTLISHVLTFGGRYSPACVELQTRGPNKSAPLFQGLATSLLDQDTIVVLFVAFCGTLTLWLMLLDRKH
jgi:hypothetical protein